MRYKIIASALIAILAAAGLPLAVTAQEAPAASVKTEPTSKPVLIYSHGVRLAGDLWTPPGAAPSKKRPALLLMHGWGGTKDQLNRDYAPRFAAKGYYVLTFDYRGWGESDGDLLPVGELPKDRTGKFQVEVREVREVVNPINQFDDIRAALLFLKGEPGVDPAKLGVWGTSLGGGLALRTAIEHPEIRVLINQIGSVNPIVAYQVLPTSSPAHPDNVDQWRSAIARGQAPSVPGPQSKVPGLKGYADHPEIIRHTPLKNVETLRAATLIIDAADEEFFDIKDNGVLLYDRIKEQTTASYAALPGKHYDLYGGASREKALELQFDWLKQHLPIE